MRAAFWAILLTTVLAFSIVPSTIGSSTISLQPVASLVRPVDVTLTTNGIILSYRQNDTSTILAKLSANGSIQPFAPSFSGQNEVYVTQAADRAGFHAGDLFLCSGDSVYRMSASGSNTAHFATPSPGSTVEYITFDTEGSWGYLLYALTGDGGVWAINATGSSKLVTNLGSNLMPEGMAVAPSGFGSYARDLLVSMENSHEVVALPASNTSLRYPVAFFPGEAPERVLIIPPNMDLLVAKYDQGIISSIPAQNFLDYVGLPLVITEGEAGQPGSMDVLKTQGTNVTVITLFLDPTSPHFEGAAFVPEPSVSTQSTVTSTVSATSEQASFNPKLPVVAAVVIVLVALAALMLTRRRN